MAAWTVTNATCVDHTDCEAVGWRYKCLDDGYCGCNWVKQQVGEDCTAGPRSVLPLVVLSAMFLIYATNVVYFVRLMVIHVRKAGCKCTSTCSTLVWGTGGALTFAVYSACEGTPCVSRRPGYEG